MTPAEVAQAAKWQPKESAILRGILDAFAWNTDVRIWRQNTGAARLPGKNRTTQVVRFGVKGAADLTGIVIATGRRVEIEVKRPGNKPTAEQVSYGEFIRKNGGIYLVVHSIQETLDLLEAELYPNGRPKR